MAEDNTFEGGLVIIHYCRLGDLLHVSITARETAWTLVGRSFGVNRAFCLWEIGYRDDRDRYVGR